MIGGKSLRSERGGALSELLGVSSSAPFRGNSVAQLIALVKSGLFSQGRQASEPWTGGSGPAGWSIQGQAGMNSHPLSAPRITWTRKSVVVPGLSWAERNNCFPG